MVRSAIDRQLIRCLLGLHAEVLQLLPQRGAVQTQAAGGRHALAMMRAQGDFQ